MLFTILFSPASINTTTNSAQRKHDNQKKPAKTTVIQINPKKDALPREKIAISPFSTPLYSFTRNEYLKESCKSIM